MNLARRHVGIVLGLLFVVLAALAWFVPPIPQPQAYHGFADQSTHFGIPHFFDSTSNLLFILAGLAGLHFLASEAGRRAFGDPRAMLTYRWFFFASVLVGCGSGYYHLAPDDGRLFWDRAAIAMALMSWLAAIVGERVDPVWGRRLLPLLVTAGIGSAAWWLWSEGAGRGDLRPYILMQLTPLLFVPLLLWLCPPRYSGDGDICVVLALYPAALACDFLDKPIAALFGFVSGHTLKHILAAAAVGWVMVGLSRRRLLDK